MEDLPYEAAVLEVVGGEGEPVGLVQLADRVDAVPIGGDQLVAPEKIARHRSEALVLEPPERGAMPLDAVEHHPSRNPRGRHRPVEDARPPAVPPERESDAVEAAARLQEAEIEARDVPTDDEVRVVLRDPGEKGVDHRGFVRETVHRGLAVSGDETRRRRLGRIGAGVHEEYRFRPPSRPRPALSPRRVRRPRAPSGPPSGARSRSGPRVVSAYRDGPEPFAAIVPVESRGLDVERDGAKGRPAVTRPDPRIDELEEPLAPLRASVEDHGAGDEPLHEEPVGGPDVGFVQPGIRAVAECLELALRPEIEGVDGLAGEGCELHLPPAHSGRR